MRRFSFISTTRKCPNVVQKAFQNIVFSFFFSLLPSQFDIDGDGSITSDELRHAMRKLLGEHASKNEIDAVVREADNNGDGTVDFEGEIQRDTNTHTALDKIYEKDLTGL